MSATLSQQISQPNERFRRGRLAGHAIPLATDRNFAAAGC